MQCMKKTNRKKIGQTTDKDLFELPFFIAFDLEAIRQNPLISQFTTEKKHNGLKISTHLFIVVSQKVSKTMVLE